MRYAAATVPRYRGLESEAIRGAADLKRLPVLEKSTVQEDPEGFRSRSDAGATAVAFRTTGSTAMPLTIYHDRGSLLANIAYGQREHAVERRFAGRRFGYPVLDLRAPTGTVNRVHAIYSEAAFRPLRPRRLPLSVTSAPADVLAAVDRVRPAVVHGYGGYLELLFGVAAASGELRHRPRAVVYSGDTMSPRGRDLIEGVFGVPVLSHYNAVEAFKIAFTCEERGGFHLHEDLCHVWLVDEDGRAVEPGERGEVVLSNLVNRGTVLLNYKLGDLARLTDEPCACGRTTSRLLDLEGRVDEVFELANGSFVYPTEVWRVFRERPEIVRYQLVQLARDHFELRVVEASGRPGRPAADVLEALAKVLGGARVELRAVPELPSGPGGKFRHLVPLESSPGHAVDRDAG